MRGGVRCVLPALGARDLPFEQLGCTYVCTSWGSESKLNFNDDAVHFVFGALAQRRGNE